MCLRGELPWCYDKQKDGSNALERDCSNKASQEEGSLTLPTFSRSPPNRWLQAVFQKENLCGSLPKCEGAILGSLYEASHYLGSMLGAPAHAKASESSHGHSIMGLGKDGDVKARPPLTSSPHSAYDVSFVHFGPVTIRTPFPERFRSKSGNGMAVFGPPRRALEIVPTVSDLGFRLVSGTRPTTLSLEPKN